MRFAAVTSFAPYLGGPQTWARLADALAPGETLEIVDLLNVDTSIEPHEASVRAISGALTSGVELLVAHGASVHAALDALARYHRDVPLLALGPLYPGDANSLLERVARPLMKSSLGGSLLTGFARKKLAALRADSDAVRAQLEELVRDDAIDDALTVEAQQRIAEARTDALTATTGATVRAMMRRVDDASLAAVPRRTALLGAGNRMRKMRLRLAEDDWTIVDVMGDAPMLEDPFAVVRAIRDLL